MVRLVVQIIGVDPGTGRESSLAKVESDRFDPDHLDAQVGVALDSARSVVGGMDLTALQLWQPEVSVVLTADDEGIRPSVHLSIETLQRVAEAGASFDFDPYV